MRWEFYLSQTESHFSPTVKPEGAGHPRVLTAAYPTSILFRILFPKRAPSFLKLSVLFCESKRSGSGLHPIYRGWVAHGLIQSLCFNCLRPWVSKRQFRPTRCERRSAVGLPGNFLALLQQKRWLHFYFWTFCKGRRLMRSGPVSDILLPQEELGWRKGATYQEGRAKRI